MLGAFVLEKFPREVHDPKLFVRVLEIFVVFELGAEGEGHVVADRPPLAVRRACATHTNQHRCNTTLTMPRQ